MVVAWLLGCQTPIPDAQKNPQRPPARVHDPLLPAPFAPVAFGSAACLDDAAPVAGMRQVEVERHEGATRLEASGFRVWERFGVPGRRQPEVEARTYVTCQPPAFVERHLGRLRDALDSGAWDRLAPEHRDEGIAPGARCVTGPAAVHISVTLADGTVRTVHVCEGSAESAAWARPLARELPLGRPWWDFWVEGDGVATSSTLGMDDGPYHTQWALRVDTAGRFRCVAPRGAVAASLGLRRPGSGDVFGWGRIDPADAARLLAALDARVEWVPHDPRLPTGHLLSRVRDGQTFRAASTVANETWFSRPDTVGGRVPLAKDHLWLPLVESILSLFPAPCAHDVPLR